jgi:hypothetical protein
MGYPASNLNKGIPYLDLPEMDNAIPVMSGSHGVGWASPSWPLFFKSF